MKKSIRHIYARLSRTGDQTVTLPRRAIALTCVVWSAFILYVAQEQLPKNAITLPAQKSVRHTVVNMAPQGWAFFTKSPRDPEIRPYGKQAGSWRSLALGPHSSPRNFFGLNRASRAQGVEIALVLSSAREKDWRPCTGTRDSCLTTFGAPVRTIKNASPEPTLCGTIGLLQERPTPWAWRSLIADSHSPERVMVLKVRC
ncbi:SdpA family antimicrobial peptide system protein [Streptomyces bungoensis]|uniref:SdpA family antimicrobial peptide system protein n=1 Tax=Streptomyces bungoensis TaxID=285568 RepID=UPI00099EC3CF